MLPDISFRLEMPDHKKGMAEVKAAKRKILRTLANPRERLAVCYHESGHALQMRKFGVDPIYLGPSVTHKMETNEFGCTLGSVAMLTQAYKSLSAEQFASIAVAGKVAEEILMGHADPESAEDDFQSFIFSGKGSLPVSQMILLWKLAEQTALVELRKDLEQQKQIVHESGRVEVALFGFPESVRDKARQTSENSLEQFLPACPPLELTAVLPNRIQ